MHNINKRNSLLASVGSAALVVGMTAYAQAGTSVASFEWDASTMEPSFNNPVVTATAGLASVNNQIADANVSASATDDDGDLEFYLGLFSKDEITASGAFDLDENTVSATAVGNDGSLTADIDTLPSFNDDVALSNLQRLEGDEGYSAGGEDALAAWAGESLSGTDADVLAETNGARIEATAFGIAGEDSFGGSDGEDAILTLDAATLSVNDNAVNTVATGSAFEGTTVIADGVTVNGGGEDASITHFASDFFVADGDDPDDLLELTADADVAMGSLQVIGDTYVAAITDDADIWANLDQVSDSSVSVSDNDVTATATLLDTAQTIETGEGAADVDATMALSNGQDVRGSAAAAGINDSYIAIVVDEDLDNSSARVDGNTVKASSNLANADQSIAVDANAIGTSTLADVNLDYYDEDYGDGSDYDSETTTGREISGGIIIANTQQTNMGASTSAVNDTFIELTMGDDVTFYSSSLSVADNAIEAVATIATASNAIALDGNTVAGGVGVASEQDATSFLNTASVDNAWADAYIYEDLDGTDLDVSNNLIRAIAVAQSNANSVGVSATDFVFDETIDGEDANENVDDPSAAIVAANEQDLDVGEDFALVRDSGVYVNVDNGVADSAITLDANAIVAAAYGNDADAGYGSTGAPNGSVIDLDATNIVGGEDGADIAAATNAQDIEDVLIMAAIGAEENYGIVDAYIDYDLNDSSLSTSGNAIQAQAIGNQATTLTAAVDAVVIDTGEQYAYNEVHDYQDVEAAFVAISEQNVDDSRLAADLNGDSGLMDGDDSSDPALVRAWVEGDVTDSTVQANNNLLSAAVIGNNQATGVELAAADIRTTVGVRNDSDVRYTDLDVRIGTEGTEGSEGTPATTSTNQSNTATDLDLSPVTVTGGTDYTNNGSDILLTMDSNFTAAEAAFYNSIGFTGASEGGNTMTWEAGATIEKRTGTTVLFGDTEPGSQTFQITGAVVTPATDPTPASHNGGGVIAVLGDDLYSSTVEVASNTVSGSAKANVAANAVEVSGVNLAQGQVYDLANANASADDNEDVEADYTLTNEQETAAVDLVVDVYASFGLEADFDELDLEVSTVAIDNNTLKATAAVNVVTNDLSIAATNVNGDEDNPVTSVLFSEQEINERDDGSSIATLADAEIFAPIASDNSTISLSGNKTQALSIANEGVNTLTVDVVNATNPDEDYAEIEDSSDFIESDTTLEAHHLLVAKQDVLEYYDADVSIAAVADATIYNLDELQGDTQGLINGSVTLSQNLVSATALANNNTNTMTFEADAVLGLTGAVLNGQTNEADVDATTTASIRVGLNGFEPDMFSGYAADASSVALNDNRVASTARGNIATNALNASGTVLSFDAESDSAYAKGESGYTAEGDLVLASHQVNTGEIVATTEDVLIGAALNSALGEYNALNASSVSVDGNVVMASATANTAYNTVTVTGYDGESANNVALANEQYTSAMVKAVVRNAQVGSVSHGAVVGSTAGVVGNTLSATATGNVASSVIKRR